VLLHAQRHPKMEMDKGDLLQLLTCMEGELQAKDVAIAALRVCTSTCIMPWRQKQYRNTFCTGLQFL